MKDFAGVYGRSAFNWRSMNRLVAIVMLGLASLCSTQRLSVAGDFDPVFGFYRPELFAAFDSSDLVRDLQIRQFLSGRLPGSTRLGQMGTAPVANFPTALVSAEPGSECELEMLPSVCEMPTEKAITSVIRSQR